MSSYIIINFRKRSLGPSQDSALGLALILSFAAHGTLHWCSESNAEVQWSLAFRLLSLRCMLKSLTCKNTLRSLVCTRHRACCKVPCAQIWRYQGACANEAHVPRGAQFYSMATCCQACVAARSDTLSQVAAKIAPSWFNLNPAYCLRSKYFYKHEKPCTFFIQGREHVLRKSASRLELAAFFVHQGVSPALRPKDPKVRSQSKPHPPVRIRPCHFSRIRGLLPKRITRNGNQRNVVPVEKDATLAVSGWVEPDGRDIQNTSDFCTGRQSRPCAACQK